MQTKPKSFLPLKGTLGGWHVHGHRVNDGTESYHGWCRIPEGICQAGRMLYILQSSLIEFSNFFWFFNRSFHLRAFWPTTATLSTTTGTTTTPGPALAASGEGVSAEHILSFVRCKINIRNPYVEGRWNWSRWDLDPAKMGGTSTWGFLIFILLMVKFIPLLVGLHNKTCHVN